ncbi:uncharacterized protein LOC111251504 [Varroa destructor]|uniref:Uncharacterized protein n=1 Tax=Varroa destructor TaxID=109461 RepID=A0A7M7KBT0_VARDE|nr:uncharacterized protein LOC111251504 [Varroa destructor]
MSTQASVPTVSSVSWPAQRRKQKRLLGRHQSWKRPSLMKNFQGSPSSHGTVSRSRGIVYGWILLPARTSPAEVTDASNTATAAADTDRAMEPAAIVELNWS